MSENVKVAVRVRPFNEREKLRNAQLIIKMAGHSTFISNPADLNGEPRKFEFDYSYWSHDHFVEQDDGYLAPKTEEYADQKRVFEELGQGVLENAWKGYNCSLFAYGQTGSGKSYSMVGYGANKGIVPVTCERLFAGIAEKDSPGSGEEFQVSLSMLEIYNEQVRDLLTLSSGQKGGLKVRESQTKGFYVENLLSAAVKNYVEIEKRIAQGTKNRTLASTNMNATSSRAHTIVAITFTQKIQNPDGRRMQRTSVINLVDLAGSERADSTGATGDRLKEGAAINKSLSTLGNVIKALADSSGAGKRSLVPYRDSVLTKLLKNALGGNSKTIMIAALSPADINYDETLSTLRFADRAKSIKTRATVNESATDKLIRELREENARLMEMLKKMDLGLGPQMSQEQGVSEEEIAQMRKEMEEELAINLQRNQKEMADLQKTWAQKLSEAEEEWQERDREERKRQEKRKTTPHLWNLNEDPLLTNTYVHLMPSGTLCLGSRKAKVAPDILLDGLSILPEHAVVVNEANEHILLCPQDGAKVLVNGRTMEEGEKVELHHNDRVLFGSSHLYVFHHPKELAQLAKEGRAPKPVTYDFAQEEIAQEKGFDMSTKGKNIEDILLQDDLVYLMPMVQEANAIAEELGKTVTFELILVSPQAFGQKKGHAEVRIQMKNMSTDHTWVFHSNRFVDMRYKMQSVYHNYMQGFDWEPPADEDPFSSPENEPVHIGSAHLFLQSLTYKIEVQERLPLTNFKGTEVGQLTVEALPCLQDGSLLEDNEVFVEDPTELIGKPLHFLLNIKDATGLPSRFSKNLHCRFQFYLEPEPTQTDMVTGISEPVFGYTKHFTVKPVTQQFLDYMAEQPLIIELWGNQSDKDEAFGNVKASSKPEGNWIARVLKPSKGSNLRPQSSASNGCDNCQVLASELAASKKRVDKLEERLRRMKELVENARSEGLDSVPIDSINQMIQNQAVRGVRLKSSKLSSTSAAERERQPPGQEGGGRNRVQNSQVCSVM